MVSIGNFFVVYRFMYGDNQIIGGRPKRRSAEDLGALFNAPGPAGGENFAFLSVSMA